MLKIIFKNLDSWIEETNRDRITTGGLVLQKVYLRVIGQTALLEAKLDIEIAATMDVDLMDRMEYSIRQKFADLLQEQGKILDPVGHEAWMPQETEYAEIFKGDWVHGSIALPVFIILSKAKFAPEKNRNLVTDYLASSDLDHRLFDLAEKYDVDLEQFV